METQCYSYLTSIHLNGPSHTSQVGAASRPSSCDVMYKQRVFMKSLLHLIMICIVSGGWICMAVIDCDVVQKPHGEWEIEMNVTDCPVCKLLFSQGERRMCATAGVWQMSPRLLTCLNLTPEADLHIQVNEGAVISSQENHSVLSCQSRSSVGSDTLLPIWCHIINLWSDGK